MSSKCVVLFAGQGAQAVGMGKDLADAYPRAREIFQKADAALGAPLSKVMFEGPIEDLTKTSWCQPALYVHGLVCLELLKELAPGLEIGAAAGLSLGEFTAHAAAGTFTFEEGLRLVAKRGRFMDEACAASEGGMAAMIGGDETAVRGLAEAVDIDVANFNAPGQIVVSGEKAKVEEAVAKAKEHGIRIAKPLQVAGAYHSRLMRPAQEKLAAALQGAEIGAPSFPVISNFLARPVASPDEIRSSLESQVTGSVRWAESMQLLLDEGFEKFVELGPGGVLAGLMHRIRRGTPVLKVAGAGDLAAAVEAIGEW